MDTIITPVQLTLAQLGKAVVLTSGETLKAVQLVDGWKYVILQDDIVARVVYADNGLDAANLAVNASDEESQHG